MLIQGYHPGVEDDGVYLPAIKKNLDPALYPHDSDFFQVQLQATVFDKLLAASVRISHLGVGWTLLLWQFVSILLLLWTCRELSRRCFPEAHAQWAAVSFLAVLLTLPVAGTALFIVDQYVHPRALATVAILAAIVAAVDGRKLVVGFLLVVAFAIHPIMAAFGVSYCFFLVWKQSPQRAAIYAAALAPLGWIFEPTSEAWRQAANTRDYYFLSRWHWYEWLGVLAPMVLLWLYSWIARRRAAVNAAHVAVRLLYFGGFQLVVALVILLPGSLERLRPLQPMRYLHLLYVILILLSGEYLGQFFLKRSALRWLMVFVPLALGMGYAQRQTFPGTEHLELPGRATENPWVNAFRWVRQNTPTDSLFAVDPHYMELPGEDFHSFRALAERSVLADLVKDPSVSTQVPRLAPRWLREVTAVENWSNFTAADFQRLNRDFGVTWVILQNPVSVPLACPYKKDAVAVCRIGE
jgi:hypothetical protein